MKTLLSALSLALAVTAVSVPLHDAEAKRLGSGRSVGMQRQAPPPANTATPNAAPAQPAAPTQQLSPKPAQAGAAAGAAASAGRRSWMAPLAGLAAGLGLAALASHFGFGEGLANLMTMALIAIAGFMLIRFLMRRFAGKATPAGPALAGAAASSGTGGGFSSPATYRTAEPSLGAQGMGTPTAAGSSLASAARAEDSSSDHAEFERIAKMMFIRMQAVNDAGDVEDLRRFTTPELFAALRLDLQDRGGVAQRTDVVQLQASVVDTATDAGQQIASVRFHGLIREVEGEAAQPFDEVWHLVKPASGESEWRVAGITPMDTVRH